MRGGSDERGEGATISRYVRVIGPSPLSSRPPLPPCFCVQTRKDRGESQQPSRLYTTHWAVSITHMQDLDELRQHFGHCQQHVVVGVSYRPLGLPLLPLNGVQALLEC